MSAIGDGEDKANKDERTGVGGLEGNGDARRL